MSASLSNIRYDWDCESDFASLVESIPLDVGVESLASSDSSNFVSLVGSALVESDPSKSSALTQVKLSNDIRITVKIKVLFLI